MPNHQKLRMIMTQEQLNHRTSCQRAAAHRSATTTSLARAISLHAKSCVTHDRNALLPWCWDHRTIALHSPVARGSPQLSGRRVGQLAEAADAPNFPRHAAAGTATSALNERFGEIAQ